MTRARALGIIACVSYIMLIRRQHEGMLLISQPAHAWVSGQLARAWDVERFGAFEPREEVCLAAAQHDIGFLEWERSPTFNPRTELPHDFMEMPTETHLSLWDRGVNHMLAYSAYAALLVSRHVGGLGRRHLESAPPSETHRVHSFLERQTELQKRLLQSLRRESAYANVTGDAVLERHQALVAAWDWMSLLLLTGFDGTRPVNGIPAKSGTVDLILKSSSDPNLVRVSPWPFRVNLVNLRCDGRRTPGTFAGEEAMRRQWASLPTGTLQVALVPG